MNGPTRRQSRSGRRRALAAALGAAGTLALGGCSVAAGPAAADPALGPVRTGSAAAGFAAFPVPSIWNGAGNKVYEQVIKAKSGTAGRNFRVIAKADMVFWLSCIGAGTVTLSSPVLGLTWSAPCGDGSDPQSINFAPRQAAVGHGADIGLTVSAGSRWEVRIDAIAPPGVTPPPPPVPSRSLPGKGGWPEFRVR
jgi:hypothetical protein